MAVKFYSLQAASALVVSFCLFELSLSHSLNSMTDFLTTKPLAISGAESPWFPFPNSHPSSTTRTHFNPNYHIPFSPKLSKTITNKTVSSALSSSSNGRSRPSNSRGYSFYDELEFEDRKAKNFGLERNPLELDEVSLNETETGSIPFVDKGNGKSENDLGDEDLIRIQSDSDGDDGVDFKKEDQVEKFGGELRLRKGKQVIRRSNLLAKQVISIRSALSLGFISQLWVDTNSVSYTNNFTLFVHLLGISLCYFADMMFVCMFVGLRNSFVLVNFISFLVDGVICRSEAKFAFWGFRKIPS